MALTSFFSNASLQDLPEFGTAHATDLDSGTGCTVFVCPEGATAGVDVRGGAPATRETDLLKPENMIQKIHAVMLSGGSAFGLESMCGAMEVLANNKIGFELGGAVVPIVCGACLFDLLIGKANWPDKKMGAEATKAALANMGGDTEMGNIGAGTGATVGKLGLPTQAMKAGFGWSGVRMGDLVVIACVAVNASGNIVDSDGQWIAGTLGADGKVEDPLLAAFKTRAAMETAHINDSCNNAEDSSSPTTNTTLGCILTNAKLSKAQATKVAQIAQDGYARAIRPVHTLNDGDAIFTMASCKVDTETDVVAIAATNAMEDAIRKAALNAQGAYGLKAFCDIHKTL